MTLDGVWERAYRERPMDLADALTDAIEQLAHASADRERLNTKIADLEIEIEGLRRAVQRHDGIEQEAEVHPIVTVPRTEAIESVIALSDEPLSPNQVTDILNELGRTDGYNAVSA